MLNYNSIKFELIGGCDPLKIPKFVFQGFYTCKKQHKQQNVRIHMVMSRTALLRKEKNIIKLHYIAKSIGSPPSNEQV